MKFESAYMSPTEIVVAREDEHTLHCDTSLNFLLAHNGFRKGKTHTALGNSHAGKSTLVRTICQDFVIKNKNKKVAIFLSEEPNQEFREMLNRVHNEDNKRILIASRIFDGKNDGSKLEMIAELEEAAKVDKEIGLFIIDNITTDIQYEGALPKDQSDFIWKLKNSAHRLKIPLLIIAHTGSDVTENFDNVVSMNSIRGSKSIVNLSNFFYIIQQFKVGESKTTTIRVIKHRSQEIDCSIFKMVYSTTRRAYSADVAMTWDEFQKIYASKNNMKRSGNGQSKSKHNSNYAGFD